MRRLGSVLLASFLGAAAASAAGDVPVSALVLGLAQDGGMPHAGCFQRACVRFRRDPRGAPKVASLGLVDRDAGKRYLVDATPDFPAQLDALLESRPPADRRRPLDGILLTHAHAGHYAGLLHLGREALGADHVPVYATPRMAAFLRENDPWRLLVRLGHVEIREIAPGREIALTPSLRVTPLAVPHRDELSDTVAYLVAGPERSLLWLPDIDKWERWATPIERIVSRVDVAFLDGTFRDAAEIPGRSTADIPHPLVGETLARLGPLGLATKVRFVHLNHTNPLLFDAAARQAFERSGARVAREGERLKL